MYCIANMKYLLGNRHFKLIITMSGERQIKNILISISLLNLNSECLTFVLGIHFKC